VGTWAGQIWEAEDKMGTKACYARRRGETRLSLKIRPLCGWLGVKHASHMLVLL